MKGRGGKEEELGEGIGEGKKEGEGVGREGRGVSLP